MRGGGFLQRIFSTFPGAWPGLGLVILRFALGVTIASEGVACLSAGHEFKASSWVVCLAALASAALLLIGYLTPLAGAAGGLLGLASLLPLFPASAPTLFDNKLAACLAFAVGAAITCLGPGAFSLDARFFGRREIVIPDTPRPPDVI